MHVLNIKTVSVFFFDISAMFFYSKCNNSIKINLSFFRLVITFANSLDPDQDRQNVGPDLDRNRLPF